jgi:hypothetical protein
MLNDLTANTNGTAVASGLMITALIDLLIKNSALGRQEVIAALNGTLGQIGELNTPNKKGAYDVISSVIRHTVGR